MPILDVDHAKTIVVIKRSMRHGSGIDNELHTNPKTRMTPSRHSAQIMCAIKTLVG
jgi:NAD(P) transhydrogenase subunit beta